MENLQLPNVTALLDKLSEQIKPALNPNSVLVGIHTGGVWVADKLHKRLDFKLPYGTLNISFYRDDFSQIGLHPQIKPSAIPFDVTNRDIILVDDVLYTGRTVRAAMNELFDYGRPARIRLAVLIDRGGRELPISAEFVGAHLNLADDLNIQLQQNDGQLSLQVIQVAKAS